MKIPQRSENSFALCRFINHFNGQSVKQKEMLAVLAGITDAIKTSGGTESTVEYFAALVGIDNLLKV